MEQINTEKKSLFLTSTFGILFFAVIATFLWGSAYPSIKIGYELFQIPSEDIGSKLLFAGYRFLFAGILTMAAGVILLFYLAFLSSAAFTLWTLLLKYNKVGKIAIYNCLVPVFGTILSALFLREKIVEFQSVAALMCVCFGIYLVNSNK